MAKLSHAQVNYGRGTDEAHCAVCHHYQKRHCAIVVDPIDPHGWCKKFTEKKMPVAGLVAASTGDKKPGEKPPEGVKNGGFKKMSKDHRKKVKDARKRGMISEKKMKEHYGEDY